MSPRSTLHRALLSTTPRAFRSPAPAGRRPALYLSLAAAGAVSASLFTGAGTGAAESAPLESVSVAAQLGIPADPAAAGTGAESVRPLEQLVSSRSERDADRSAAAQAQAAADQAELDRRAAEEAAARAAAEQERAAAELRAQAAAQQGAGPLGPLAPAADGRVPSVARPPSGRIVRVGGINVDATIAEQLAALLAAAAADGLALGGGGFRDSAAQLERRAANCGTTHHDLYERPASQCRPPTARPGHSMHERGLAVDFTLDGALIGSTSNRGYRWLAANAARFGLFNLPGEPWHWSTDGR